MSKSLDPGRWLGIPMKTVTTDEIFLRGTFLDTPRRPCIFFTKVFLCIFVSEKDRGRSKSSNWWSIRRKLVMWPNFGISKVDIHQIHAVLGCLQLPKLGWIIGYLEYQVAVGADILQFRSTHQYYKTAKYELHRTIGGGDTLHAIFCGSDHNSNMLS